jgi:hypothetical protein
VQCNESVARLMQRFIIRKVLQYFAAFHGENHRSPCHIEESLLR